MTCSIMEQPRRTSLIWATLSMPQNGLQLLLMIPTTFPVGFLAASAANIDRKSSLRYCSYKGQITVVHGCFALKYYPTIRPAEFYSYYKRKNNIHSPPTVSKGSQLKFQNSPLSPRPLLQHYHPLRCLRPAARLRRAPPTDPAATAALQPHPGALLC